MNDAEWGKFLKHVFGPRAPVEGVYTHEFVLPSEDEERRLFEREYRRLLYNVDLIGGL